MGKWEGSGEHGERGRGNMVKWEWCYLSTSCCPRVAVCPGESVTQL